MDNQMIEIKTKISNKQMILIRLIHQLIDELACRCTLRREACKVCKATLTPKGRLLCLTEQALAHGRVCYDIRNGVNVICDNR